MWRGSGARRCQRTARRTFGQPGLRQDWWLLPWREGAGAFPAGLLRAGGGNAEEDMKQLRWMAAGVLAAWGAGRLASADRARLLEAPAAPLMSFTPHAAVAALGAVVLLRRRPGPAITAA